MHLAKDKTVRIRQKLEAQIITMVLDEALKQGYYVRVDDGGELHSATQVKQVALNQLMETDEDYLHLFKGTKAIGWVRFVYGNDGYDVICDYSANDATEAVVKPATDFVESL